MAKGKLTRLWRRSAAVSLISLAVVRGSGGSQNRQLGSLWSAASGMDDIAIVPGRDGALCVEVGPGAPPRHEMPAMWLSTALTCVGAAVAVAWLGVLALARCRAEYRPGDVAVQAEADADLWAIAVTVHNPGSVAVLVGLAVRRCGIRLWLEGGSFVSAPRRTTRPTLLARQQTMIGVVEAGETEMLRVPLAQTARKSVDLVASVGQSDRLRVIHQRVALPSRNIDPLPAGGHGWAHLL